MKCYSRDDETFSHETLGALFDEMRADGELTRGAVYYEADCEPITAERMSRPQMLDGILTMLDEDLHEDIGETAMRRPPMPDPTKKSAERAFLRWRDLQPYQGATERERRAFLAGVRAAACPAPAPALTEAELLEHAKRHAMALQRQEAERLAALPAGSCPECNGDGELGGQFCGGFLACDACGRTGKAPAKGPANG